MSHGRPPPHGRRRSFLGARVVGALRTAVLGPPVELNGYGRLSDVLSPPALIGVLLLVGVAPGYGARWAGGGTSRHGLSGCAAGSPDSLVTMATSFSVAVLVTLTLHALTGGLL